MKRAMMKEIIGDTRVMLREVWGAMCLTEDATKAFAPALEEVFTEEALAAHETHLAACRTKLEGMQPILKMVERREYIRTEEEAMKAHRPARAPCRRVLLNPSGVLAWRISPRGSQPKQRRRGRRRWQTRTA